MPTIKENTDKLERLVAFAKDAMAFIKDAAADGKLGWFEAIKAIPLGREAVALGASARELVGEIKDLDTQERQRLETLLGANFGAKAQDVWRLVVLPTLDAIVLAEGVFQYLKNA